MRFRLLSPLLLVLLAQSPAFCDTVYLTNGRSFEGVIAEETATSVKIQMPGGSLSLPRSHVLRVEKSASDFAEYLKKNRPAVEKFTKVTQRAFAECVQQPKPCVQALIDANGALSFDNELVNWQLVEVLMSDKTSQTVALGWHDDARMKADYELVRDYVGVDKPFDVRTTYTNDFLDKSIKMKPIRAD